MTDLSLYIKKRVLLRPYLVWVLESVLYHLTDEEAVRCALDKWRWSFLKSVAAHTDPRVALIGKSYLNVAMDFENELRKTKPEDRVRLVHSRQIVCQKILDLSRP